MFRVVDELPGDLRRFMSETGALVLPFCFVGEDVGTAIVQLAAGKAPADLLQQSSAEEGASPENLRVAAQRFVAKVMLAASSDLFTVLGVSMTSEPAAYRDNYRRLMAMVHPDARPIGFPNDAAIRVNHAYAVLSDAEQLERYKNEQLAKLDTSSAAGPRSAVLGHGTRAQGVCRGVSRSINVTTTPGR